MGIAILLLALFLLVLAAIAFAAIRIFSRRDAAGKTEPLGCLTGCAIGLALFFLGLVGLVAFAGALAVLTGSRVIGHGPIRRVWVGEYEHGTRDSRGEPIELFHDPARPLHVVLEVRGDAQISRIVERIERLSDGETVVRVHAGTSSDGEPVQVIDIAFPADEHDLREIERDVREVLDVELDDERNEGVHIELRGIHDDRD